MEVKKRVAGFAVIEGAWSLRPALTEQLVGEEEVESGVEVRLHLKVEADGEIDANPVEMSVKESVRQFNPKDAGSG